MARVAPWLAATAAMAALGQAPAGCALAPGSPVLEAPDGAHAPDLDLLLHWRSAEIEQRLLDEERRWKAQTWFEPIVRDGEAHRALLLLPSVEDGTTRIVYRVEIPEDCDCELVSWVTLDESAAPRSDGVDFAVSVESDSSASAGRPRDGGAQTTFARLPGGAPAAWREARLDLAPYRGETVSLALEVREPGDRSGDWLLWGDPRVRHRTSGEPVKIDVEGGAGDLVRPARIPWREVNVFKAYYAFNDEEMKRGRPTWIGRYFPWLASIRLFSSLGGNWGPTLERDYEGQMGRNPAMDLRPESRWAREFEFFRQDPEAAARPIDERFAWPSFDLLMERAATTGLGLHLNLAGAPETFTGGAGYYGTYHYNEMPVVDEMGWKTYVAGVFAHLATKPWFARARFSFFSEANCRWIDGAGKVLRTGFQGDAAQHARQYVWTWQAMKPSFAPSGATRGGPRLHLGPWVVEPDPGNPEADNLGEYLDALTAEFGAVGEALPPWSAFAFNLYETPLLPLDGFASYKLSAVRKTLARALPGIELPLRLDEYGIHPLVESAFHRATGERLEASRWAATWHAEMLALLLAEDVASAGPWMASHLHRSLLAYLFMTYVSDAIALEATEQGELRVASGKRRDAPGAAADEGVSSPSVGLRLASRNSDRVGAAWSVSRPDTVRLLLWRHPRFVATDERHARSEALPVEIDLPGGGRGWRVAITRDASQASPLPSGGTAAAGGERPLDLAGYPGVPSLLRDVVTVEDILSVDLRDADLLLIEARPLEGQAGDDHPPSLEPEK